MFGSVGGCGWEIFEKFVAKMAEILLRWAIWSKLGVVKRRDV